MIRAFIEAHYHPKILAKRELVDQFTRSFAQLHHEFGPLEYRDKSFIAEHKADKFHLFSPAAKQWVSVAFMIGEHGKIGGHGLWKLEGPPGWIKPPDGRPLSQRLREHLGELSSAGLFSGAVLVTDRHGVVLDHAVGVADGTRPLRSTDRFPIASITKIFTAAGILLLEESGKLSLEDSIARFLPEFPRDVAEQVKVRHLLTHTSGIELDDDPEFNAARAKAGDLNDVVATQVRLLDRMNEGRRAGFRPLERFDYSNENYDLLGAIIERSSGQRFDRFLATAVFRPAGLESTSFAGESTLRGITHRQAGQPDPCAKITVIHDANPERPGPAGGLFSTTHDLHKFFRWLQAPRSRNGSLLDRMLAKQVVDEEGTGYGLGLQLRAKPMRVVGHNGGVAGASSELRYFVDENLLFVALSNRERAAPDLFFYLQGELGR